MASGGGSLPKQMAMMDCVLLRNRKKFIAYSPLKIERVLFAILFLYAGSKYATPGGCSSGTITELDLGRWLRVFGAALLVVVLAQAAMNIAFLAKRSDEDRKFGNPWDVINSCITLPICCFLSIYLIIGCVSPLPAIFPPFRVPGNPTLLC